MAWWSMALGTAGIVVGVVVLFLSIRRVLALLRDSEIARLPAAASGQVRFEHAGTYVLHIEQPRLSMVMQGARFTLRDATAGADVPSSPVLFRTTVSGFATVRLSVRYFHVDHPGVYRVLVDGINTASDVARVQLIFTRPFAAALVLWILGILFGSGCLIGGMTFTALRFTGKI